MNNSQPAKKRPVYGAAGRIGLVVPANNSVIEPELWSALPSGVAAYATRVRAKGQLTPEAVHLMERDVDAAVDAIASTGVDLIAYCDMVTTFIMDPGWNEDAVRRFQERTGVQSISAWTSLRDALSALGVRRFALGTPYPRHIHDLVAPFFEKRGYAISSAATLDIIEMADVPTVSAHQLRSFARSLDIASCDALVLLATDLPTFDVISELESEFRVPVLGSNQTLLWRALSILNQTPTRELGRLFHYQREA